MASVSGSGLDVAGLVSQLVQAERAPAARFGGLRLAALARQTAWADLGSRLTSLSAAAAALDTPRKTAAVGSTSSDPSTVQVTAANGALPGASALVVRQLATSEQRTSGPLTGPASLVGAGQLVLGTGLAATGLTAVTADGALAAGRHTVTVHAPEAAVLTASAPPALQPAASDLTVTRTDGTVATVALRSSYADVEDLAADLRGRLAGFATVGVADGRLVLTGVDSGSAARLEVGGAAAAELGLPAGPASGVGHTASLAGGARVALAPGGTAVLAPPAGTTGTLTVTAGSGPLSAGTVAADVVRTTATTTLEELTAALGAAGSPVAASLLDTGDGSASPYRLSLTATSSGTRGAVSLSSSVPALSGLTAPANLRAAQDARFELAGVTLVRSSNTVTDALPDVTLNLLKEGPATVTVTRDTAALTTRTRTLVDGLNAFLTAVGTQTRSGLEGAKAGPLAGSGLARSLVQQVQGLSARAVGAGATTTLSQLGIGVSRTGAYTLDEAALARAVGADPDGAAALLSSFSSLVVAAAGQLTAADGTVSSAGRTAGKEAAQRQKQIDDLDLRLQTVERRYRAQYAKLDAAMSVLNGQASRLAGQIGGLPTWSS